MRQRILGDLQSEQGFTLVELTLVVLIMAILMAVAVPTFLSARKGAEDRAAQSSVRNTLTAARTYFTDGDSYSAVTAVALRGFEPSLAFVDQATSTGSPSTVSVNVVSSSTFTAAAYSKSGHCWYARDFLVPGVPNAGTTWNTSASDGTNCAAGTAPASGWTRTF